MKNQLKFRDLTTNQIVTAEAFPADATLERRYSLSERQMRNVVVVTTNDDRGYSYDEFVGVQVYPADDGYANI